MVQDQPSVSIKHHGFKIVQARPSALAQDHGQEPAGWGFPEQWFFSGILPNKSRVAKIISMELVLICSTADKTVPFIAGPEIWIGKSFFLQGVAQLKTVSDKAIYRSGQVSESHSQKWTTTGGDVLLRLECSGFKSFARAPGKTNF